MKNIETSQTTDEQLLVENGFLRVQDALRERWEAPSDSDATALGSVLLDILSLGFRPDGDVLRALSSLDAGGLERFWRRAGPALQAAASPGVEKKDLVQRSLRLSDPHLARAIVTHIFEAANIANGWFRPTGHTSLTVEIPHCCGLVLSLETAGTFGAIYALLRAVPEAWSETQRRHALQITRSSPSLVIDISAFTHRDNGLWLAAELFPDIAKGQRHIDFTDINDARALVSVVSEKEKIPADIRCLLDTFRRRIETNAA